ncbi:selenocysteine-specific translation elongation factor [Tomitella fengzijianii]|uniref:Selenocysteine-specific translation elongation factor n=1 Tax=Tomitella fengzijianii TaxID=2597660 RepID=A0A516WZ98_9ACTN|nr:selenocysteine-specific translation elongation factor [Tomitella fengzijianii]QDQ96169.1 selenocysteine-specific translation elongation factor [Tomitella fengzijianii]
MTQRKTTAGAAPAVVLATAGHVDHGKSTLVRALTGTEPDRWDEERRRGLTIDLGFASMTLDDEMTVAFVDVPGHRRFVANMLAGVGPVPAALFVVAADDGWMPQSQEHLEALAALGVRRGILVITRCDLMEPDLALAEARDALAGTGLADIPAVPVSAATGAGMDALRAALAELARGLPRPDPGGDVRLWVDRAFTISGAGTVVTGTLGDGAIEMGDALTVGAGGRRVTVRGLQSLGRDVRSVKGTVRVALNLRGAAVDAVPRGTALLTPGSWRGTSVVDVRLDPGPGTPKPARLPESMTAHIGSASTPVRVRVFADSPYARLTLGAPLPLRVGDRLILRDPGTHRIPAGAAVLDPSPPPLARRGDARRRAEVLADLPAEPAVGSELRRRGWVRSDDLSAWGVPVPDGAGRGGWLIDDAAADALAARLVEFVRAEDRRDPLEPGVPAEAARRELGLPDAHLIEAVLARPGASALRSADGRITLPGSGGGLPPAVRAAADELQDRLRRNPFAAPTARELDELGLGRRELAACARADLLVEVGPGVWLAPDAPELAAAALRELPAPFTPSQARGRLGTSRRVMMPLLELLARRGLTRRVGDGGHEVVGDGGRAVV